jgi:aminopeptidase N
VPERDYDLQHVSGDLTIDYEKRSFAGVVVNTLSPLREGVTVLQFDCGKNLSITACEIDGRQTAFTQNGECLKITSPRPLSPDKRVAVTIRYYDSGTTALSSFHWHKPTVAEPSRIGFWTKGEPNMNRQWLPTWDYPNDFATTEMRITVPADWYVISNGVLKSNIPNADGKTRTFHWKMEQPYATYLISLIGGPLDIKTARWRGIELIYAVPKGKGHRIDDTFGDTPDILSFFSETLGVNYPWPKYAQTLTYDFPGAMENISASTLDISVLADKRRGYKTSVGGIAHELAHQWFGDLVTCRHWGELWLNEGFAVLFAHLYQEHRHGKNAYDSSMEVEIRGYISDSRHYKRPLSTQFYKDASAVFDSHSYNKGAAVLHTLRRTLGDKKFYAGLHHYLAQYRHKTVDSHDLCRALTEATGIDLEPFFDQWVYKPGHPVIDYTWRWDEPQKQVIVTVRQIQDTSDGTPIYDLNATIGLIHGSGFTRKQARLYQAEQEIRVTMPEKPDAVLLDPDHDFLREIPTPHWTRAELPSILKYAPHMADRQEALNRLLTETPSEAQVRVAAEAVRADKGQYPVFRDIHRLGELKDNTLRPLFREQIAHPNYARRTQAIRALEQLPKEKTDQQTLRNLINNKEPYSVVRAALRTLGNWDAPANRDIFDRATKLSSPSDSIRLMALDGLAKADAAEGKSVLDTSPSTRATVLRFLSARAMGTKDEAVMEQGILAATDPNGNPVIAGWLNNMRSLVPLADDDAQAQGIEMGRVGISRICFYKLVTEQEVRYLQFFLTTGGKVAGWRNASDLESLLGVR